MCQEEKEGQGGQRRRVIGKEKERRGYRRCGRGQITVIHSKECDFTVICNRKAKGMGFR